MHATGNGLWFAPPGDGVVVMVVPEDREAVDLARTRLCEAAGSWGLADLEDMEVVASELITNAIVHARSQPIVRMVLEGPGQLLLEVADRHPEPPVKRIPYEQHTRGLGLHIVDALTEGWGVEHDSDGHKVVWGRLVVDRDGDGGSGPDDG